MPFAIVDRLESIQIEQHDGERFASPGRREAVLKEDVQSAPVANAGQRIGQRELTHALEQTHTIDGELDLTCKAFQQVPVFTGELPARAPFTEREAAGIAERHEGDLRQLALVK